MNCIEYPFDEVVTLFDKQRVPLSSMDRAKRQGKYRYYGAQGIIDYIDDYIFDGEYLLLAEDGENLKSNKQNLAQLVDGKFWVNNHAHILRTKRICRLRYFYYWINSKNMTEYVTGSAQPKLSQSSLKKMVIPLPSLEVQDKILGVIIPIDEKIKENARINKKQKGKTVFIDARKMGHMVDRKHRDFSEEDIQKLADTFSAFQNGTLQDVKGFCAVATTQDIAKQDYILTPGRYVGIEEQKDDGEPFDKKMSRLTSELSEMFKKSHELEDEIRRKLKAIGYEI